MSGDDSTKDPGSKRTETRNPPPPPSSSNHHQRGGLSAPNATFNVEGNLVAGSKTVHNNYYGGPPGKPPWTPTPPLRRYLDWLSTDKALVNLRGIGGGDIHLQLAAVYVPLSLRRSGEAEVDTDKWRAGASRCGDFEISGIFGHLSTDRRRLDDRHALILGDPGSGKSTAMRKLDLLIRDQARRASGEPLPAGEGVDEALTAGTLAPDYLPVRVPLRDFTRADLSASLRDFIARELDRRSGESLDDDVHDALWAHGKLVLILDGLDEIAEVDVRDGFCRKLNSFAAGAEVGATRIIMTSRVGGYRELSDKPGSSFARVRLESLSSEQAERLIGQWFHALVGQVEDFSDGDADARTAELARAIGDSRFEIVRRSMYATPLILTLLCVMNYRACRMPESRVEFYDTCLRMLLETWPESKQSGVEPGRRPDRPLTTMKAIELLAPLAFAIHAGKTGEQLHRDVLLARLGDGLGPTVAKKREVFAWLHLDAGVFEELAPKFFGFFHLGVQEYLAALHVAMAGASELGALAGRFREARWSEVILMAGALPLRRAFAPLMRELLARFDPANQDDVNLVRLAVREGDFDAAPFAEHLANEAHSGMKALEILGFITERQDADLAGPAVKLAERARAKAAPLDPASAERKIWEAVEARAMQLVAAIERGDTNGTDRDFDVAVVGLDDALAARREVLLRLRTSVTHRLRVWPPEGDGDPLGALDIDALTSAVNAVLVIVGDHAPWDEPDSLATAQFSLLAQDRPLTVVLAPRSTVSVTEAPTKAMEQAPIDLRAGWDFEALLRRLRPGAEAEALGGPVVGRLVRVVKQVCVEPRTGMRFLYVPEGEFTMGSESLPQDACKPEHRVHVPEFWISETPVTNRIYRLFVEATRRREPMRWRDRRFDDPEQPVVTVSWNDAKAFCAWMSKETGWAVGLPSEAQWEYAARGTDGRPYPWGWDEPDRARACFGQGDEGRPAPVGSYPAGMGPFGALDQSGNVWEWCEDVWNPSAYRDRKQPPAVNEAHAVTTGSDAKYHSVRGGSWYNDNTRGALAAAYRYGHWLDRFDYGFSFGFRVVVAREPG